MLHVLGNIVNQQVFWDAVSHGLSYLCSPFAPRGLRDKLPNAKMGNLANAKSTFLQRAYMSNAIRDGKFGYTAVAQSRNLDEPKR
jgi:hypothetical protein